MSECKCDKCGNFKEEEKSAFQKWYTSASCIKFNDVFITPSESERLKAKIIWNAALDAVLSEDCLWKFIVGKKFKVGEFKTFIEGLKEN